MNSGCANSTKTSMDWAKMDIIRRIRVRFQYADEEFLYVQKEGQTSTLQKVRYGVQQINDEFSDGIPLFWPGAQLNLLDVACDAEGIYTPSFIVLEPDYLLDISTLAECYRDYGNHPANFLMSRLMPSENSRPLLLARDGRYAPY